MEVICGKKEWYHPWHVMGTEPAPAPLPIPPTPPKKEKQTPPTVLKSFNPQASNFLLEPLRLETKNMKMWS